MITIKFTVRTRSVFSYSYLAGGLSACDIHADDLREFASTLMDVSEGAITRFREVPAEVGAVCKACLNPY